LIDLAESLKSVWVLDRRRQVIKHAGVDFLEERIGSYSIPLVGTGFVQVNRSAATRLEEHVRDRCGDIQGKRIVDAYCGFGLRALDLARSGALAAGIERDRHAIKIARQLAERVDTTVRFMAGDVERILDRFLPADIIILNPPRRGVDRPVIETLLRGKPERIVYVSCDPATLARDINRLGGAYSIDSLKGFDLFPQTAHVETVAALIRTR
jgi:tRNA/tmRNA/rRNA uracil-C5-methylase (TrmA/RlmC/RlmD family)